MARPFGTRTRPPVILQSPLGDFVRIWGDGLGEFAMKNGSSYQKKFANQRQGVGSMLGKGWMVVSQGETQQAPVQQEYVPQQKQRNPLGIFGPMEGNF